VTDGPPTPSRLADLGRLLEIQNLGLNLPFALAFLLIASHGLPSLRTTVLLVVAFVAARNAGHSFNRYADRDLDAQNPRTAGRALVTGRATPGSVLALTALSAGVVVLAAALLNPLALLLSPVALALVLGYSLTKRRSPLTTLFLGLVECVTPAAAFIGVTGTLPPAALLAVGAIFAWGTAFETIHSLGDLETDAALGLPSLPRSIGEPAALRLIPILHIVSLTLLTAFGVVLHLAWPYYAGLGAMAAVVALTDREVVRHPRDARTAFRRHFVLSALYLVGTVLALFLVR
jgi:4-hydroxybenzoate polyprenyltransferase